MQRSALNYRQVLILTRSELRRQCSTAVNMVCQLLGGDKMSLKEKVYAMRAEYRKSRIFYINNPSITDK